MYDSDEQRDADIDELAAADPPSSATASWPAPRVSARPRGIPDDALGRPGRADAGRARSGPRAFPGMRLREVEIHHADLGAGYTAGDWPTASPRPARRDGQAARPPATPFEVRPLDPDRTWLFGAGDGGYPVPVVTGPAATSAWWLTGRGGPARPCPARAASCPRSQAGDRMA